MSRAPGVGRVGKSVELKGGLQTEVYKILMNNLPDSWPEFLFRRSLALLVEGTGFAFQQDFQHKFACVKKNMGVQVADARCVIKTWAKSWSEIS